MRLASGGAVLALVGFVAWNLLVGPIFPGDWYRAEQEGTDEAYETYIREHPDDEYYIRIAKQRIGRRKHAFYPQFFLTYQDQDLSGQLSFFRRDITSDKTTAASIA